MSNKELRDFNADWDNFWKEIVCNEDDTINVEQLKKELSDFSLLMHNVSIVYCHVTGNAISKPLTDPETVCAVSDDSYKQAVIEQAHEYIKEDISPNEDRVILSTNYSEKVLGEDADVYMADCVQAAFLAGFNTCLKEIDEAFEDLFINNKSSK